MEDDLDMIPTKERSFANRSTQRSTSAKIGGTSTYRKDRVKSSIPKGINTPRTQAMKASAKYIEELKK